MFCDVTNVKDKTIKYIYDIKYDISNTLKCLNVGISKIINEIENFLFVPIILVTLIIFFIYNKKKTGNELNHKFNMHALIFFSE